MPLAIRRSADRGHADHGWLDSRHTFSFADYHDPRCMGFRSLRVINQDRVRPGSGFGTHPHRDMEIFSYVLAGTLQHKDSMGNGRALQPGEIQLMSAGTGVTHSEFNPSQAEPLHFLQVWIQPHTHGLAPSYTEWHPDAAQATASKVFLKRMRQSQYNIATTGISTGIGRSAGMWITSGTLPGGPQKNEAAATHIAKHMRHKCRAIRRGP